MNDHEVHEVIMKQVCKELCLIAEQIQKNQTMNPQDLEKLDKLYHLKKDMQTTQAMDEASEYEESKWNGNSGMRGRSPMTGRYVSRAGGSYADGYSQGYSEAMNQMNGGNSGYYPGEPPRFNRW